MRAAQYLSLLAAILIAGCSPQADGNDEPRYEPRVCVSDSDCSLGARTCQFQRCVDGPSDVFTRLSIAVEPPEGRDDLAPFVLRNVEWQTNQSQGAWQLQRTRTVQGAVRQTNNPDPVRGTLFFEPKDGIAGRRYVVPVDTDAKGAFHLSLPPGPYTVTVRPEREEIPESMFEIVVDDEAAPVNFQLPSSQSYVRWSGRLVRLTDDYQTAPLEGVTLWATSSTDGRNSTPAVTDANGHFSVQMHSDVVAFRLQVRGRSIRQGDETLLVPSATFRELVIPNVVVPGSNVEIPGFDLILGLISPATTVEGSVTIAGSNVRVDRARVMATARPVAIDEEFTPLPVERSMLEIRATTDIEGQFEMQLPGGYEYTFTAAQADYGILLSPAVLVTVAEAGDIPNDPVHLSLDLAPTRLISVTESDGKTIVDHYDITASLMSADNANLRNYDLSSDQMSVAAHSAFAAGLVQLPLVDGLWRVVLTGRADYTLPQTVLYLHSADMPDATMLAFDPGFTLAATIVDELNAPLRGATVEVWSEEDAAAPRLLAVGKSDAQGVFRLIVPWLAKQELAP